MYYPFLTPPLVSSFYFPGVYQNPVDPEEARDRICDSSRGPVCRPIEGAGEEVGEEVGCESLSS